MAPRRSSQGRSRNRRGTDAGGGRTSHGARGSRHRLATRPRQPRPRTSKRSSTLRGYLRDTNHSPQQRLSAGISSRIRLVFRDHPLRDLLDSSRSYPLDVARTKALAGAWYEIFPRSAGAYQNPDGTWVSGTLERAAEDLPRIAGMGFDVVYLTPIHPIGTTFRKGKNNSLTATPGDPGSPYGIGSPEGGHDAIHPDLGTFDDFDRFVDRARSLGMEVALDLALQCSPDHPWVTEHPEWFTTRADGTIAYAENPPKKYQDIYPLNFDNDPEGIYQAVRDVIELWIHHGVTIFRVDNPPPSPFPSGSASSRRHQSPVPGHALPRRGLHAPRHDAHTRRDRLRPVLHLLRVEDIQAGNRRIPAPDLHGRPRTMRPGLPPTTHDILTPQMWDGGTAIFAIRAMLAALGAPTWGIYSGYEFVENEPRGSFQEPNDNEKYEYRPRHWEDADAIGISRVCSRCSTPRAPSTPRCASSTRSASIPPPRIASSRSRARCPESSPKTATPTPSSA